MAFPRWAFFLPLGAVVFLGALYAFRLGWIAAYITETAAIEAYAARYLSETGARAADCSAVPGERVWLVIRCGSGKDGRIYRVNRFGGLTGTGPASDPDREPRT